MEESIDEIPPGNVLLLLLLCTGKRILKKVENWLQTVILTNKQEKTVDKQKSTMQD